MSIHPFFYSNVSVLIKEDIFLLCFLRSSVSAGKQSNNQEIYSSKSRGKKESVSLSFSLCVQEDSMQPCYNQEQEHL